MKAFNGKCFHCWGYGNRIVYCKKHGTKIEKSESEVKKALGDVENDLVLCTKTETYESMQKTNSFPSDMKFIENPHTRLLPKGETSMMCFVDGEI